MEIFSHLELAMFSGKGGVGKSTLSCAFACDLAKKFTGEKIMLLSTDPAHSLGDILKTNVTNTPCSIDSLPNLWVRALDAKELLRDFKQRYGSVLELLVELILCTRAIATKNKGLSALQADFKTKIGYKVKAEFYYLGIVRSI